jgi:SAM-dependent methyltransferase
MDRPDNRPEDLAGALADIGIVNRWLGGARVVVDALRPYLRNDGTTRILDVGTGGADLPLAIAREAERLGRHVEIVGIDRDPATVALAKSAAGGEPSISIRETDAFATEFADGAFDVVTASMFLHHFVHADAVRLIREFRRIARRAVLVNDLERHAIPWAFIWLGARLTRRHPMFVHDAPLSVLRGFTPSELAAIAKEAGAPDAKVHDRWPYRLLLEVPA